MFQRSVMGWGKENVAYLSVANGSDEPPKFVELTYKGSSHDAGPFALVGKGITFDRQVNTTI